MNETWRALASEAGLAAEHLAIGTTALGKANYAQDAFYSQAFFSLTIGLERAAKLAMVVDHVLDHRGTFPVNRVLRAYSHDLKKLLEQTDEIANRRGLTVTEYRLPRTMIHEGIIKVLSDFASNITRYYNLDLVTGNSRTAKHNDPIHAWFDLVVNPVLAAHYRPRHHEKHKRNAKSISELFGNHAMVLHHSERGESLDTIFDASMQTGITDFAKPYIRMYVMQIVRFLANLLSELGDAASRSQLDTVPHLSEFFAIFNNSDKYFRKRKTWSIYRP